VRGGKFGEDDKGVQGSDEGSRSAFLMAWSMISLSPFRGHPRKVDNFGGKASRSLKLVRRGVLAPARLTE